MADSPRPSRLPDPDAPLLEQMGGVRGLVTSSIPILAFVPVNIVWGLTPAIWAALGTAVVLLAWTVVRRENVQPAISGLVGVAVCVFIAWRTGSAKGYFLYGIITQAAYGAVFAVSVLVRWPLVGVIWGFLDGTGTAWRRLGPARRWYAAATWVWAGLFAVRFALQFYLYRHDEVTWLGAARIAMGWPLAILGFAITLWAVNRAMAAERAAGLGRGDRKRASSAAEPASDPS